MEVEKRMRMDADINQFRYALEKLPQQTEATKNSIARLKMMTVPKTEAEAREIIGRLKEDESYKSIFGDQIALWQKQLESPDPLLRADAGRRVTHQIWRFEFLAKHGEDFETRLANAQAFSSVTGQEISIKIDD